VLGELALAVVADPVGAPRRVQHSAHLDIVVPGLAQHVDEVVAHSVHGRTAGVGRGDRHDDALAVEAYVAQHAEVEARRRREETEDLLEKLESAHA
jgi:hypothetical protein